MHSGGPFWEGKDIAAWSIPKGEFEEDEDPLQAAIREFIEETSLEVPEGKPIRLTPVKQSAHKDVHAWVLKGDLDPAAIRSNTFEMEWPPGSGKQMLFPEVDKACWFSLNEARKKLHKGQVQLLDQLLDVLHVDSTSRRD